MKIKMILASVALISISAASSQAATLGLSDFFQDWKLDSSHSSGQCASTIGSIPGDTIPGVMGMPGTDYDNAQSIRFRYDRGLSTESEQVLTLGNTPDGNVTLNDNVLRLTQKKKFLFFSKISLNESFTLGTDGGLNIDNGSNHCVYQNSHPQIVGKIVTGASLLIDGVKVSECTFAPASPRPDQVNFIYNEACDLGKYTDKTTITSTTEVVKEELAACSLSNARDVVIVRSSKKLNAGTENWLSLDSEIFVLDDPGITLPPVDDVQPNNSEYFISPYETSQYKIGATNGVVQINYGNP